MTERTPPAILVAIVAMYLTCGHVLRADADVPNQTKKGSSTTDATISSLNLPDPLIMNDGQPVKTVAQWRICREEMKKILLENFIGEMPPMPGNVEGAVTASTPVLGGKVVVRQIDLKFGPDQKLTLKIAIFTPVGAGPFPTFVQPNFFETPHFPDKATEAANPTPTPAQDANQRRFAEWRRRMTDPDALALADKDLFDRGYALATYGYTQSAIDNPTQHSTGYFLAYPNMTWGGLGVFAWTMSRCVDYLETLPYLDHSKLIDSRLGKTALIAGAIDERFALVAPVGSGCAGTGLFRINGAAREGMEGLEEYVRSFPYHVSPKLPQYAGHADSLPFDQHWMIALVAPRPLISAEGLSDQYCNGKASKASYYASLQVYKFLNAEDNLGINYRPGTHAYTPDDWRAILDFADSRLLGKPVSRRFDQVPPDDQLEYRII
jgi:hypothetical protein